MNKLLSFIFAAAFLSSGLASAQNKTTYKDTSGRTVGSSSTDNKGNTTYKDTSGRTVGSSKSSK